MPAHKADAREFARAMARSVMKAAKRKPSGKVIIAAPTAAARRLPTVTSIRHGIHARRRRTVVHAEFTEEVFHVRLHTE